MIIISPNHFLQLPQFLPPVHHLKDTVVAATRMVAKVKQRAPRHFVNQRIRLRRLFAQRLPTGRRGIEQLITVACADEVVPVARHIDQLADMHGAAEIHSHPSAGRFAVIHRSVRVTIEHVTELVHDTAFRHARRTDDTPTQGRRIRSRSVEGQLGYITMARTRPVVTDVTVGLPLIRQTYHIPQTGRTFLNGKQGVRTAEIRMVRRLEHAAHHVGLEILLELLQ